jgi:hypothetical protein
MIAATENAVPEWYQRIRNALNSSRGVVAFFAQKRGLFSSRKKHRIWTTRFATTRRIHSMCEVSISIPLNSADSTAKRRRATNFRQRWFGDHCTDDRPTLSMAEVSLGSGDRDEESID